MKVVLAKVGLDGHDKGIRLVALALRDAGVEVIYLGLRRTAEVVVRTALDEDVDVIGLSVLSGAHLGVAREVLERLRQAGAEVPVVMGGTIPLDDVARLKELGVAEVFPVESDLDAAVAWFKRLPERSVSSNQSRRLG